MGLLDMIYYSVGPDVIVDESKREFEIVDEGLFFENLTRAYYIFRGYKQINSEEN